MRTTSACNRELDIIHEVAHYDSLIVSEQSSHSSIKSSMVKPSLSRIRFLMQPNWILFGIAVFNYVLFWSLAHRMAGACVACPWFYPWNNLNEPTLLLVDASLVLFERKWSLALSLML